MSDTGPQNTFDAQRNALRAEVSGDPPLPAGRSEWTMAEADAWRAALVYAAHLAELEAERGGSAERAAVRILVAAGVWPDRFSAGGPPA